MQGGPRRFLLTAGLLYVPGSLLFALSLPAAGVITALAAVMATDTGAYYAGHLLGGPKVWPRVSPKKTWAGSLGGLGAALAVCLGLGLWLGGPGLGAWLLLGFFLSLDQLARLGRGQGGGQTGRAHDGREHHVGLGQGGRLHVALRPVQNFRGVPGGQQGAQFTGQGFVQHHEHLGPKLQGVLGQAGHVAPPGQGHHLELSGMAPHHRQGRPADGPRGPQNGQTSWPVRQGVIFLSL